MDEESLVDVVEPDASAELTADQVEVLAEVGAAPGAEPVDEPDAQVGEPQLSQDEIDAIDLSQIPGCGPKTVEALKEAGFTSLVKLSRARIEDLTSVQGIAERGALRIIGHAQEHTGIGSPKNAATVFSEQAAKERFITTGSDKLDELLCGGIRCGYTWEIAGKNGHGKSQLASQVACWTAAPKELGGFGGKVLWVDTENTGYLLTGRWKQMLDAIGAPPEVGLANIDLVIAENMEMQTNAITRLLDRDFKYDLIVIDGLMTKARAEFAGRGQLAARQNMLSAHLDELNNYAQWKNAAVILTNQVMDKPDMMYGDPTVAIGGHVVGHSLKYRLWIRRGKGDLRIIRVAKAADLAEGEAPTRLTDDGFCDA